ncbi:MAG: thioredoxin [Eubacterium sp.]|nr:thioredoxin [Eubacterium sp.]
MRKFLHSDKLKVLLLAGAVAMCIFGAVTGEADVVFRKAVNICMECIGLG